MIAKVIVLLTAAFVSSEAAGLAAALSAAAIAPHAHGYAPALPAYHAPAIPPPFAFHSPPPFLPLPPTPALSALHSPFLPPIPPYPSLFNAHHGPPAFHSHHAGLVSAYTAPYGSYGIPYGHGLLHRRYLH